MEINKTDMKKVLIAIDYNPNNEPVVTEGHKLAKLMGAEVCLFHVLSEMRYYSMQYEPFMGLEGYPIPMDYKLQEEYINVARTYLEKTATHLNDENVSIHLAEGDTARRILEYAEDWGADMIVMGTHSHSTLEKIFLGTVASTVLEKTKVPVYMVPVKV